MKVLLGITGSVAATLTPKLTQALYPCWESNDADLSVVFTERGHEFVWKAALFSGDRDGISPTIPRYRDKDEWKSRYEKGDEILHIKLAQESDILIIAPVTANTLAKMANGVCDNLLTCIVRAWGSKPMILAPAMNTEMWNSPFTATHLEIIRKVYNVRIVPPVSKMLACGQEGIGAMADITDIVATKDCVKTLMQCAEDIGEELELN